MSIDMSKLASGAAYGASAGTIANGLLTKLSPDEWSAVGVLAGILVALLTLGMVSTGITNAKQRSRRFRRFNAAGPPRRNSPGINLWLCQTACATN